MLLDHLDLIGLLVVEVVEEILLEEMAEDLVDLTLVQVRGVLVLPLELLLYKTPDLVEVVEEMVLMVLMVVLVSFSSHIPPN